ncbi:MAG: RNA methyltransferase [Flavobacteriaceae bacterium]|jgi:23S rRNA (guanosine2251-2'-O)-methyltransferase
MRKLKNSELNRKTVAAFKQAPKTPLIIILDDVRSLNNIGSVFRTADAFLIDKIYLCGITAIPPHKDIHKTALGATESIDWEYQKNAAELVKNLKAQGVIVFAIEQTENSIGLQNFEIQQNKKYAFVLGNEVKGVSQQTVNQCDGVVEIPQEGTKHSLNISVATGVVIWAFYQKFKTL